MADQIKLDSDSGLDLKYKDMGDGSFALVVFLQSPATLEQLVLTTSPQTQTGISYVKGVVNNDDTAQTCTLDLGGTLPIIAPMGPSMSILFPGRGIACTAFTATASSTPNGRGFTVLYEK